MVGESGNLVCSARRAVGPALRHRSSIVAEHATIRRGDAGSTPAGVTKASRVVRSPSRSSSPSPRSDSRALILGCGGIGRRWVYPYLQDETRRLTMQETPHPNYSTGGDGRAMPGLHAGVSWHQACSFSVSALTNPNAIAIRLGCHHLLTSLPAWKARRRRIIGSMRSRDMRRRPYSSRRRSAATAAPAQRATLTGGLVPACGLTTASMSLERSRDRS